MKNIKLTEEHKVKLLEMCERLFSEHKNVYLNDDDGFVENRIKISDNHYKTTITMHWFEFCVNHLSKKIFTINNKVMCGYDYFINNTRFTKKHLVDYLYEEFLKINNDKFK